jgi:urea transport system substrate-binding protein
MVGRESSRPDDRGAPADLRSEAGLHSILVVDDDPTILQAVSEALQLTGYNVATATNGLEALQVVEVQQPEVVLLDLRMPVMDGWQFARVARARNLQAKIIVMTATTDARRQAEQVGADAVLAKPFGIDQLIDVVERLCAQV